MKNALVKFVAVGLFAAAVISMPVGSYAGDMGGKPDTQATATGKSVPFHGKVAALNATTMTVTVGERTFQGTGETKITRNGNPAKLSEAAVGDNVGGAYKKSEDGTLTATTLNFNSEDKKKIQ